MPNDNIIDADFIPAAGAGAPAKAAAPAKVVRVAPFAVRHPQVVKAADTAWTGISAVAAIVATTVIVTVTQHCTRKWLRPARVPTPVAFPVITVVPPVE